MKEGERVKKKREKEDEGSKRTNAQTVLVGSRNEDLHTHELSLPPSLSQQGGRARGKKKRRRRQFKENE